MPLRNGFFICISKHLKRHLSFFCAFYFFIVQFFVPLKTSTPLYIGFPDDLLKVTTCPICHSASEIGPLIRFQKGKSLSLPELPLKTISKFSSFAPGCFSISLAVCMCCNVCSLNSVNESGVFILAKSVDL